MKILKDLYIGNTLRALDPQDFFVRIGQGETVRNAYVITLSSNPANQLDFVHTLYLRQQSLFCRLPLVVGVASDKEEAVVVLERILGETMEKNGSMDMRSYLAGKEQREI